MATPPIPPEATPLLQYLPALAQFIRSNRHPSRGELSLLRMFAPTAFQAVKSLSYEQIVTMASPYEADPELGEYVKLVKSDQGRAWLTAVLDELRTM